MKLSISTLSAKTRSISVLFASLGICALPNAANAIPVTWTVTGSFDDGGTFSGSFTYDADTDAMSAWNLSVAGGTVFAAFTYSSSIADSFIDFPHTDDRFIFCSTVNCLGERRDLRLALAAPLTDAGGLIALLAGPAAPHPDYGLECSNCGFVRNITSGSAQAGVSVPEPATLTLFGIALGGLGAFRMRRNQKA